jgi:hypothetical protein
MSEFETPVRPAMRQLFEEGSVLLKGSKFRRVAAALSWRQKYLTAEIYPLEMNETQTLNLKQVKNGMT